MGKYFVVVLSAIVLAACSGKNGTVTGNNGVGVTDFEIGIVEKSLTADYLCEGDATFGDSVKLYTRTHVTLQWPEKLGNADVKPLQDTLLARCFGNERPTSVDEAMSRYVADPVTMDDGSRLVRVDSVPDVDIDVRILERSIDVNVLSVNSRYAAFEIYGYMYGGGAHPVYSSSFVNFDVAEGKVLGFDDIVLPGRTADLTEAVKSALREQYNATTDEQLLELAGINAGAVDFSLQSPMFYFDGSNVVFYFNPYEIGPWAIGAVTVSLPWYSLDTLVRHEVLDLLGWH